MNKTCSIYDNSIPRWNLQRQKKKESKNRHEQKSISCKELKALTLELKNFRWSFDFDVGEE